MSKKSDSELLKQRQFVVQEIVKTEHTYNMALQMVNTLCTKKFEKMKEEGTISFSNEKIFELFKDLEDVEAASRAFVEKLHNTVIVQGVGKTVADAFEGFTTLISTYFTYIYLYHEVSDLIKPERANNPAFEKVVSYLEQNSNDTIEAFLITPIQRPPRYRLLVQELIKHTPETFPEYPKLQESLKEICDAIANVDNRMEEFDEFVAMTEFQEKISDFDVIGVKGRRMYFQGHATKFSRSYTNNRYLVLFSDTLLVAEPNLVVTSSYKVNKVFPSGEYMITNVDDSDPFFNAVDVRQKDKSFRCNLDTKEAKTQLLEGFDKMMKANNLTRAQLEVRGFAPVWIPNDLAPRCMECNKQFTFFIRRHHCRWCGKCVCADCWKNRIKLPGLSDEPKHVCNECYARLISMEKELNDALEKNGPPSRPAFLPDSDGED